MIRLWNLLRPAILTPAQRSELTAAGACPHVSAVPTEGGTHCASCGQPLP